jgi:hypothetical protein
VAEDNRTKIVDSGDHEPTPEELKKRQAEILGKLRSVTPDQIEDYVNRSLDADVTGEGKEAWQKTVWRK